jgi:hypothetical protein
VLGSGIDRLLARTDPFDLSQAVERHVRTLSGERIRALLRAAGPRLGDYYRDEFARLAGSRDFEAALAARRSDNALQSAFVKFLKSNLRTIPIFGSSFGMAVLEHAPLDRAVAIGEERSNPFARLAVAGGAALALVVAGAAGEHVIAGARVAAQSPQPVIIEPPATIATPRAPARSAVTPAPAPVKRVVARVSTSYVPTPAPEAVEPAPPDPAPAPTPKPTALPRPTPPSGSGAAVVTAAPQTPTPEPSDIDTSDMPESYSDATPLPSQSPAEAQVPQPGIRVPTPKPSPKKRGWLRRTFSHLNPFKP